MTSPAPTQAVLTRTLAWSVVDGVLHAIMLGTSESYMGAFAVELGHEATALALLTTVPPLLGGISQLLAPALVHVLGSRQRLVVLGALLQAFSHVGFVLLARTRDPSLFWFLLAKIAFWTSGLIITPPWNAWIGSLTEPINRARYFLWRTAACHLALLVSFLWAGAYLQAGRPAQVHQHFAVLFLLGLVARLLAAGALSLHVDPDPPRTNTSTVATRLQLSIQQGPWKLAVAIALLQFGAHVSVPFFTPYMLRTLHLELDTFAQLTSITIVTKALSLPIWNTITRRTSLAWAMTVSVAGVAVVPAAWAGAHTMPSLIFVHVLGGVAWSGFEYVSFQLLLGNTPKHISVEFFSLSSALSGVLQLGGSLMGSWLLGKGTSYAALFLVSSVLRAVPLLMLTPVAAQLGRGLPLRRLWLRLISVRPSGGVERRPVIDEPSDDQSP